MIKPKVKPKASHLDKLEESDHEDLNREILEKMEKVREEERRRNREIEKKMREKSHWYEEKRASVIERKRFLDMLNDNEALTAKREIDKKYGNLNFRFDITENNKKSLLTQK
jgi:DNA segregation ATPase FtsK/SpoIIIE-like protein